MPPVRYGLIIGCVCALIGIGIEIPIAFAQGQGSVDPGWGLAGCIAFLVFLWLLGEAGYITVRQTGRTEAGIIAGALAGLIGGLALGVGNLVLALLQHATQRTDHLHMASIVIADLVVAILVSLMGAGGSVVFGALGASVGKARNRTTRALQADQG